jgi:hypothetical protein
VKYIPATLADRQLPTLELTRRNLEILLAKLDDPESARTIIGPENNFMVRAVENEAHYANRPAGPMLVDGEIV